MISAWRHAVVASGTVGPLTTTVLIAGDDTEAKAALAQVATDGGLSGTDAGGPRRARALEAQGFLQIPRRRREDLLDRRLRRRRLTPTSHDHPTAATPCVPWGDWIARHRLPRPTARKGL
jgi:hypothetical protein